MRDDFGCRVRRMRMREQGRCEGYLISDMQELEERWMQRRGIYAKRWASECSAAIGGRGRYAIDVLVNIKSMQP